jgi:ferric-chelate reductase
MRTFGQWAAVAVASLSLTLAAAQSTVSSADICTSAAFAEQSVTTLGDGPVGVRALVVGDEVCFQFGLSSSVASDAAWFGVGVARGSDMVSTPEANAMIFKKESGKPELYHLGGYVNSEITTDSDTSSFVVSETDASAMAFSYQRKLAAVLSDDVSIDANGTVNFIWAYATSWPISSHRRGTNGAATFTFSAASSAGSTSSDTPSSSTTSGTSSEPEFCEDKNCPAIVGGIAFAAMLLGGLFVSVLFKATPVSRVMLQKTLASPPVKATTNAPVAMPHTMFLQNLGDLHIGEAVVMLIFVAAVIALVALNNYEDAYVRSGRVCLLILMFLILPVARIPLWSVLFGTSFERIVKYHRWLGMAMTVAVIVHLIQALKVTAATNSELYGTVTPVYGFIAFLCFATMTVLANEYVRRKFFEVFYFTHRILSIVGFVFSILHAPKVIGWALVVPLVFYAIGLLSRWSSAFFGTYSATVTVPTGVNATTLVLEATPKMSKFAMDMNRGSYFMVRIPSVSNVEWHPFSAIVTANGKSIGFCARAMGGYTKNLLKNAQLNHSLTLNLCGPFGKMGLDVEKYEAVVLVGGGVGITPLMSLVNQCRLFPSTNASSSSAKGADWQVVWSVRDANDLLMMDAFLPSQAQIEYAARVGVDADGSIQDPNQPLSAQTNGPRLLNVNWAMHVSEAQSDGTVERQNGELLAYRHGMPILDETINTSRFAGRRVAVVACGPPTMTVEAQALARSCGFDFHKEVFNW